MIYSSFVDRSTRSSPSRQSIWRIVRRRLYATPSLGLEKHAAILFQVLNKDVALNKKDAREYENLLLSALTEPGMPVSAVGAALQGVISLLSKARKNSPFLFSHPPILRTSSTV